jgi:hypothetical protein
MASSLVARLLEGHTKWGRLSSADRERAHELVRMLLDEPATMDGSPHRSSRRSCLSTLLEHTVGAHCTPPRSRRSTQRVRFKASPATASSIGSTQIDGTQIACTLEERYMDCPAGNTQIDGIFSADMECTPLARAGKDERPQQCPLSPEHGSPGEQLAHIGGHPTSSSAADWSCGSTVSSIRSGATLLDVEPTPPCRGRGNWRTSSSGNGSARLHRGARDTPPCGRSPRSWHSIPRALRRASCRTPDSGAIGSPEEVPPITVPPATTEDLLVSQATLLRPTPSRTAMKPTLSASKQQRASTATPAERDAPEETSSAPDSPPLGHGSFRAPRAFEDSESSPLANRGRAQHRPPEERSASGQSSSASPSPNEGSSSPNEGPSPLSNSDLSEGEDPADDDGFRDGEVRAPTAVRPPLRQLGLLELAPAVQGESRAVCESDAHPLNSWEVAGLEWARTREAEVWGEEDGWPVEDGGPRGGVLLHSGRWRAEAIVLALVAEEYHLRRGARCGTSGGSGAMTAGLVRPRRTLLVCTATSIDAIERALSRERLAYARYDGSATKRKAALSSGCPVVLATYGMTIAREVRPPVDAPGMLAGWRIKHSSASREQRELRSHLHTVPWHRVVLFDAHAAANPSTQRAKAVAALRAVVRWAVGGPTPATKRSGNGVGAVGAGLSPLALTALVQVRGARCPAAVHGRRAASLALVREPRGDLATLEVQGRIAVGGVTLTGTDLDEDEIEDD